jgi:hypothetical protein
MRKMPTWLTVENASSRLRWCWAKHMTAPTSAEMTPIQMRMSRREPAWAETGELNTVQYTRANAYSPSSVIAPENRTQTGMGATV